MLQLGMYDKAHIAAELREAADRLESRFRAAAFRRAAATVEASPRCPESVAALPAIAEMLIAGRWSYLERLRREERVFSYTDEEGVEHDCTVLALPRTRLHGRDAIAALLDSRR